jgi:uncharacterized membrane protein
LEEVRNMSAGNMSLLCIVDSSKEESYGKLHEILWSALEFFGMPYEIFDVAKGNLSSNALKGHSAIIVAQEKIGESLSVEETELIMDAVKDGVGLVCFDGNIRYYKDPLKKGLGLVITGEAAHGSSLSAGMIRVWDNTHYITATKDLEFIRFNKPVDMEDIVSVERDHMVLLRVPGSGCPALITETYGKGRVALFTLSSNLWLSEFFGHGGGLDDIFWRSIIWAAKKPFVMLAMPPFVTMRIDDCSGEPNDFKWVKVLNKHGFIPHLSLFIDNIGKRKSEVIRELYENKLAEFSVHAFTWTKQVYWKPKSPLNHNEGTEYSEEELKRFFEKIDMLSQKWGIKWSKVFLAHFGEAGRNVIPFLKERGIRYLAIPYAFSTPYGLSPLGLSRTRLKGLKPFGGQCGVIDYHPDDQNLFIIAPDYSIVPKAVYKMLIDKGVVSPQGQNYDFLWEVAQTKVDVNLAAWYAAFGIKLCLGSLMPAVLTTHEQPISMLTEKELDEIFSLIDKLTSCYRKIYRSWSYIAEYAENLYNSKLIYANYSVDTEEVQCRLKGGSSKTLYLYVFENFGEKIKQKFKEIPPYKGEITISFKVEDLLEDF